MAAMSIDILDSKEAREQALALQGDRGVGKVTVALARHGFPTLSAGAAISAAKKFATRLFGTELGLEELPSLKEDEATKVSPKSCFVCWKES